MFPQIKKTVDIILADPPFIGCAQSPQRSIFKNPSYWSDIRHCVPKTVLYTSDLNNNLKPY